MDSLFDPERLLDRENVDVREETRNVTRSEFETVRETVDSHVAVGVTNDEGEVLLVDDGSHGWTLVAAPVESGDDWVATGRRAVETLIGIDVELDRPERLRRVDFHPADDPDRRTTMYNVVFRATSVARRPVPDDGPGADRPEIGWFDRVPADQEGGVADDIRLFVDSDRER
ncbi:NUDIX hydrolase [Halosolutus gelatinilyticus]|uniref:NUDIX hydrolase n=1 Tax=Halosolutus gelatinilyticus TaxID=2931975 RepID=UPI001FF471C7|nr:NUDIX domain-containing protein [Halosolutus gelatinilyticus]